MLLLVERREQADMDYGSQCVGVARGVQPTGFSELPIVTIPE